MKFVVLVEIPLLVLIDESLLVALVLGFVDKLVEVKGFAVQKNITIRLENVNLVPLEQYYANLQMYMLQSDPFFCWEIFLAII